MLVVDDEFGVVDLIDAVLTDEGHRVVIAANGRQGLEVLAREYLHLAFLGCMMPAMDGAAVLGRIMANASWQSIYLVLMSSMPAATVAERCSDYAAFLREPFRIGDVVALAPKVIPGSTG